MRHCAICLVLLLSVSFAVEGASDPQPTTPSGVKGVEEGSKAAPSKKKVKAKRKEKLRRARRAIKTAAKQDPENSQLWLHLGLLDHKLGDLEAAQKSFEKVVALGPSESAAHYMLALIYEKKDLIQKAISSWGACLAHSEDPNLLAIAKKHLRELKKQD